MVKIDRLDAYDQPLDRLEPDLDAHRYYAKVCLKIPARFSATP